MGLPKEWFIGGDLSRPIYKPPFEVGFVQGGARGYPCVCDAEGRIVSFGPGGQNSFFGYDEVRAERAAELLNSGKSYEEINIHDLKGKKPLTRKEGYALTQIEEGMFTRYTEDLIRGEVAHIGRTNPELVAQIKEEIADNLVGFDPEKRRERVEAIKQLAALPEEANPLKELIAYRFSVHPGDEEREASLLLIPGLTYEWAKKSLLQRIIDWDPNKRIVAKAKALLRKQKFLRLKRLFFVV